MNRKKTKVFPNSYGKRGEGVYKAGETSFGYSYNSQEVKPGKKRLGLKVRGVSGNKKQGMILASFWDDPKKRKGTR